MQFFTTGKANMSISFELHFVHFQKCNFLVVSMNGCEHLHRITFFEDVPSVFDY